MELTSDSWRAASPKLRQGYIREPHVAVEIEAYRPFFILGEVAQPGQYPYVANMTVETAVAIAGGFAPRALRHNPVVISRNSPDGAPLRMTVPLTYRAAAGRHGQRARTLVLTGISVGNQDQERSS